MCDYCGCREFPVIGALSAEHVEIAETAGLLRRAIAVGQDDEARRLLAELTGLLAPHVAREERGLFAELAAEGSMADTVEALCAEHTHLEAALRVPGDGAPDWSPVLSALDRLHEHIEKEENGLFPAAVILLSMSAWERVQAS